MKKYAFLVYHKEYEKFLEGIQELGVVHVIEKQSGVIVDEATRELHQQLADQQSAINFLKKKLPEKSELQPVSQDKVPEIINSLQQLQTSHDSLEQKLVQVSKEIGQLKPWGQFSWETVNSLKESGWKVSFYSCPTRKVDPEWVDKFFYSVISEVSGQTYFITVTKPNETPDFDIEEIKLPALSLSFLQQEEALITGQLAELEQQYKVMAVDKLETLMAAHKQTVADLDFRKVELNTTREAGNKLMLLEGWVPVDLENNLLGYLSDNDVLYYADDPSVEDDVPIKLKNNAFAKLFEVIGSLYSLPNYREIDLTPFFAPFFMLFFGFCLGDTGYGLLILIATLILRAKAKPNMKPIWTLGALFGVSTVVMGLLGGTVFGIMLVDLNISWIESFKKIILDQNQLMILSIALGVVQIVFGMMLKAARAIKMDGIKYALSTIGWVIIILGVGGSFLLSYLKAIPAPVANYLMLGFGAVGGVLALFFNSPGKSLFLNFGLGLWDTYGTVTGLLGDVLSYIRLFALGLSSAVLGSVFNKLAFDLTGTIPVLSQLFTILILLVGHTINFFMAALGSFVHPLRLTFVEFYKNTGFSGGGKKYQPFGKID